MSDLQSLDAAARREALDVARSFLVQAPAGSGKTELLTQRCLALLATVRQPEAVLAITFTRKAAAEMRERIVGALRESRTPGSLAKPPRPETLELAARVLDADLRHGWRLLENPGRLRIQTIDALNLALARRLPMLSGLGAAPGVAEDAGELYREAAERLLSHLTDERSAAAAAVTTVLEHLENRAGDFVELVVEMLARRESWLPVVMGLPRADAPDGALAQELNASRAWAMQRDLELLRGGFCEPRLAEAAAVAHEAALALAAEGQDSPLQAFAAGPRLPGAVHADAPLWSALAELLLTNAGLPRKAFNRNQGLFPTPAGRALKQRAQRIAEWLAERGDVARQLHRVRELPAPEYEPQERGVLAALVELLRLAVAELELVFAARELVDYPRLAVAARQALGTADEPTDTALAFDAQLQHVLVDEFQDTSEAQVALLLGLTAGWQRGDGRTLFLVGDPMQSIYRFRGADVGLYLDVRRQGLGAVELVPLALRVNFRSTRPLVDWVNAAFGATLPPRDDALRGAVAFTSSVAAGGAGREGGVLVHALLHASRETAATRVVEIVRERLAVDLGARVAVLVQARSHLLEIVAALGAAGIEYEAADIDPLGRRPAVLDLLSLTRALAHLADRPAWLAVLRAPWCGLGLADLHQLVADRPDAPIIELLREDARLDALSADARGRARRLREVLGTALAELPRLGLRDTVERAWLALSGPATVADPRALDEAEAYLDHLAELERRSGESPDLEALERALEDLYAPTTPRAAARVELMTIHKAKGLQFDTVIVPALERRTSRDRRRLLHWAALVHGERRELVVAPVIGAEPPANPLYGWLDRIEHDRQLEERRRLLYVAATRAERALHLIGSARVGSDGNGPALRKPGEGVALELLWPVLEPEFAARLGADAPVAGDAPGAQDREPRLRRLPSRWVAPRPAAGPRLATRSGSTAAAPPRVAFDWASETARHVGTVVHRELQRIAREPAVRALDAPGPVARWRAELAELGVPEDRRAGAVQRVRAALERTLDDARGRWALDSRHRAATTELALTGRVGAQIVHVVVDRCFVDAEGCRWIIDYKTSSHEGAGLDEFLDREQERYRPQLERYAALVAQLGPEPVRLGLYFPLLSAWREWPAPGSVA